MKNHNLVKVKLRITGGDIVGSLKKLNDHHIAVFDVMYQDELSAYFSVKSQDLAATDRILQRRGDQVHWETTTLSARLRKILKSRMIFLLTAVWIIFLTFWVPSRIFFVEVKGNLSVPDNYIFEIAEKYGLYFGVRASSVRSDALKNSILADMDQLDWIGITTAGCVATIEVKEKALPNETQDTDGVVSSIIAACDGVVEEITVTGGTALCKVGQAVREGQVLISAYEDCGFKIKAGRAKGEVYAQTMRQIQAVTPLSVMQRQVPTEKNRTYRIQIGKNIINFNNSSGISPPGCVKIYEQKYLTLPGGYRLPLSLWIETSICYQTETIKMSEESFKWLDATSLAYIEDKILAGLILNQETRYKMFDQYIQVTGTYICREQIGKNRIEETLNGYGKNS